MKTRYTILKNLVELRKVGKTNDMDEVIAAINSIPPILEAHKEAVALEVKKGLFEPINGIDWNVWAYDTEYDIESVYDGLMDVYHDIHYKVHGFVSLAV